MRKFLFGIFFLLCYSVEAQFYNAGNEYSGTIRAAAAYTHDFPGLNGGSYSLEYIRAFNNYLEGGVAAEMVRLNGVPRTASVEEYTRSSSVGFQLYYLPIKTQNHIFRLGLGYGFSFYQIRRSYPKYNGEEKNWVVADNKGRSTGIRFSGEYEYQVPGSRLSIGLRASAGKAYDGITSIGPFIGLRF